MIILAKTIKPHKKTGRSYGVTCRLLYTFITLSVLVVKLLIGCKLDAV